MQHTADDLTALIKERYRSKADFAKAAGVSSHTLYSILAGESFTSCSLTSAMAITRTLDLDPYAFAEGRLQPASQVVSATLVPVYNELVPGKKPETNEQFPVPEALLQTHPKSFMLRVHGNAMNRVSPTASWP